MVGQRDFINIADYSIFPGPDSIDKIIIFGYKCTETFQRSLFYLQPLGVLVTNQETPLRFALTGAAGFIAPKHLRAIKDVGGKLVAALDPRDGLGIVDQFGFYRCDTYIEPERFDRYLNHRHRDGEGIQYLAIASPNYLHDAHIRMALHNGADAICEKPLVIKPHNLDALAELEAETGRRVFTILQMRLHPALIRLQARMAKSTKRHIATLVWDTPRGDWYHRAWKGDLERSGGLFANIGIHLGDAMIQTFGPCLDVTLKESSKEVVSGIMSMERADVSFRLSIEYGEGRKRQRILTVDGKPINLTDGFEDLHTASYKAILAGKGFGIADARPGIELAERIRDMT